VVFLLLACSNWYDAQENYSAMLEEMKNVYNKYENK